MSIYLSAIVLAIAATVTILGTCMLNSSPTRAAPVNIIQPR